jgi:hypothetical protein
MPFPTAYLPTAYLPTAYLPTAYLPTAYRFPLLISDAMWSA